MAIHPHFNGRLVMLGFGSLGQGVLPLILRHIEMPRENIHIVTGDARGAAVAAEYGIAHMISSLMRLCRDLGALYLDTCVEP